MIRYPFPMKPLLLALLFGMSLAGSTSALDYKSDVLPIMKERCWKCHSNEHDVKGNLALDDLEEVRLYQVGKYNIIRPGNPDESNFLERLLLDSSHTDFMPRKADPLPKKEIETIEKWIQLGAVVDRENPSEDEAEWVKKMAGASTGSSIGTSPEFLTWTNAEGKEIEARFLSLEGDAVQLLLKSGRRASVPLSKLSDESAAQARSQAEAR